MIQDRPYFFCGVGGSGMLPLALILRGLGAKVDGSDRSLDQGRTGAKFDFLRANGIGLFSQDGSGVTQSEQIVVISAAVEDTVPDVVSAKRVGAPLMKRAELLAQLFNAAPRSIAVGGTSGKSTTTAMIGWILAAAQRDPTIMNGAVMKNFLTADAPFASALVGKSDIFVAEVDESDGSIALYTPRIAIVNNIALDHMSMEKLRELFGAFVGKAERAVLNLDNGETARLARQLPPGRAITYSLKDPKADLFGEKLQLQPAGVSFTVRDTKTGAGAVVDLKTPGLHNVSNALAAIAAARACDASLEDAARHLSTFAGVKRRMEVVGETGGVTVIDDFGHNPDKIAATLTTLRQFPGRLLIMFQPHGYGPLKLMKAELIECFAQNMSAEDILVMPDPVYFGGTTDKSVTSADIVAGVREAGRKAFAFAERATCGDRLVQLAKPGDRIVVMGARDDTLSMFAADLLMRLTR